MVIQFFLAFFGSVLVCAIALAVVVKNLSEGFATSGKKPFVYGALSGILTSLAGYLAAYLLTNPFELFWYLGGIFLLFGIVHLLFVHKRYFGGQKYDQNKVLVAEIVFGLSVVFFAIVVFSSLQYFLKKDRDFLFYPVLLSSLLFFVPLLFSHSFQAAFDIPATTFPTWHYPLNNPIELPDPEDMPNERILVIGFEIAKKTAEGRKTYFRAKGPESMKLGEFFYHFMNEYNESYSETPIEYADRTLKPHEWWFSQKTKWFGGQRIYNPEISIRENGIKENTVIVCERIPRPEPISSKIQQRV
ncbi:TssN family type VI secretion system protein [Flavisolibacter ginsenosidimutans]|uniref:TssN family type VI secretion system protein n=1 Tax=Flavisolibacter ginsenosidimutans TaxID=661481 RepID=UPI00155B015D|nr:TssN family type VI secretion system protein [Flavisolibacter ginsenosidimutans]